MCIRDRHQQHLSINIITTTITTTITSTTTTTTTTTNNNNILYEAGGKICSLSAQKARVGLGIIPDALKNPSPFPLLRH